MSSSKVLLGFVAGAAVGALAGILFAPDKGSKTRGQLGDKANDWKESARETFDGFIDGVKSVYTGAKDDVEEYADSVKSKATSTARNEVKNALS